MKILKMPFETKISCECGCEFEFEANDVDQTGYYMNDGRIYSCLRVICPVCKRQHILQEKISEAMTTNTGGEND